jgi:hypothetical protein
MRSVRFNRPVVISRHAAQRMAERDVPPELLLRVIDEGQTRYSDNARLWSWLEVPGRDDNLLCAALWCWRMRSSSRPCCTTGS